jgi:hypothetical protein
MKTWVYYLDNANPEVIMLYRVKEDLSDQQRRFREDGQVYNRRKGWIADDDLIIEMNRTGFVSSDDVISQEEAELLTARLNREYEAKQARP